MLLLLLLCWLFSTIGEEVIGLVNYYTISLTWLLLKKLYVQTSMMRTLQLKQLLSSRYLFQTIFSKLK
ncbi:hypothetical protein MANES_03G001350v8 [Manihot esculenta]|uniref:Uncharacterized protein n=1 Tax=Manihot esculenta TaxID=3983 RepID=A0ACB7HXQ7_MANES|nr:hypothetical protein MANES_03G001350v8 [Manihot esculenta]